MMSAPMIRWVSTLFSGVKVCREPSMCEAKRQPSGVKDLEAAAVRQDRAVPVLEAMEAAGFPEGVQSGTEIEMVGVAENDFRADILLQIPVIHALDGADGPDGHEDGGMDGAMVGLDDPRAGGGGGIGGGLAETEHLFSFNPSKIAIFRIFLVHLHEYTRIDQNQKPFADEK